MAWANLHCCIVTCKEPIYMDTKREAELRRSSGIFYCIWGHQQYFKPGGSADDEIRRERDRLKQQAAQKDEELARERRRVEMLREQRDAAERRVPAAKGRITKMKKREAEGVCPCCDAKFMNLKQHMLSKHPEHGTEEIEMTEEVAEA